MSKRGQRILQEVLLLGMAFGEVSYDSNGYLWVHVRRFPLPPRWSQVSTELLIELPAAYPQVGPDGFYLDSGLRDPRRRSPNHYFEEQGRNNRYAHLGWAWFCPHQEPLTSGGWRATADIMKGDNLVKYVELIRAILNRKAS